MSFQDSLQVNTWQSGPLALRQWHCRHERYGRQKSRPLEVQENRPPAPSEGGPLAGAGW